MFCSFVLNFRIFISFKMNRRTQLWKILNDLHLLSTLQNTVQIAIWHSIIIETHLIIMNTHDYSSPVITTGHYQIWLRSIVAISQSTAIWSSDLGLMQYFCCSLFGKSISPFDFSLEFIPQNLSCYLRIRGNPAPSKYNNRGFRENVHSVFSLYISRTVHL